METYFIFDHFGANHATIKAKSLSHAIDTYVENGSKSFRDMIFAVKKEDLPLCIEQMSKLK